MRVALSKASSLLLCPQSHFDWSVWTTFKIIFSQGPLGSGFQVPAHQRRKRAVGHQCGITWRQHFKNKSCCEKLMQAAAEVTVVLFKTAAMEQITSDDSCPLQEDSTGILGSSLKTLCRAYQLHESSFFSKVTLTAQGVNGPILNRIFTFLNPFLDFSKQICLGLCYVSVMY